MREREEGRGYKGKEGLGGKEGGGALFQLKYALCIAETQSVTLTVSSLPLVYCSEAISQPSIQH